ncbi:MAG: hypothetical protein IPM06_19935 [Rhizobiales bacterium]|nr:hypothetical protein [Hyphomicrobiales bacterium]
MKWSDGEIARKCAVSAEMVRLVRKSIFQNLEDTPSDRTVTRNGTTYTQNTANIGNTRTPASEPTNGKTLMAVLSTPYEHQESQPIESISDDSTPTGKLLVDWDETDWAAYNTRKEEQNVRQAEENIRQVADAKAQRNGMTKASMATGLPLK